MTDAGRAGDGAPAYSGIGDPEIGPAMESFMALPGTAPHENPSRGSTTSLPCRTAAPPGMKMCHFHPRGDAITVEASVNGNRHGDDLGGLGDGVIVGH